MPRETPIPGEAKGTGTAPGAGLGKVLITGASSGIGLALAKRLLEQGVKVVGLGRNMARAGLGGKLFRPVVLDLADLDTLPGKLQILAKEEPDVEAVVSNAGAGTLGGMEEQSYTDIRRAIDLNLTSHLYLARAFLPVLKRNGRGRLLFLGSESGRRGGRGGTLYCAAKFGLRGVAQSLREECAKSGVAVGIINPGMVRTPFFDDLSIRPGPADDNALLPEEVADAISWILQQRPGLVVDELDLTPLKKVVERQR